MEKKLIMTFKDEQDKKFNLIVNSVKEDISIEEIKAIMNLVVSNGVIQSKNGAITEKVLAVVVDTKETQYEVL